MRMNDRRFGPDAGPGLTGGVNVGMRRPAMEVGLGGVGHIRPGTGMSVPRTMNPMAAQQIMPTGRAYAKGGMVGCDWKAPSSKTMRGAARKGK